MPDRDAWCLLLEKELPDESRVVARNLAITSMYAEWYLRKPDLFKWAGMAAFASRQVGFGLAIFELIHAPSARASSVEQTLKTAGLPVYLASLLHSAVADRLFLQDLDLLRKGNNSIYRDIAWAHVAYLHGGLAEVESGCCEREREFMLAGFRMIDEGRKALASDERSSEARLLIREGNILLLRHEQLNTLQPIFDIMTSAGRVLASFGSELDFSCGSPEAAHRKASFAEYAGYFETLSGMRSVASQKDRWSWIERAVLPAWESADCSYCSGSPLQRELQEMASGKGDLVRSTAMTASDFCRDIGLG
ncbi:DUF2515 family protein [Chlorobium sp.]|uniref:DUF2515 family protein n=1 Tax=Chlorobium sp. TaxID=1095 RepID=UPI002F417576